MHRALFVAVNDRHGGTWALSLRICRFCIGMNGVRRRLSSGEGHIAGVLSCLAPAYETLREQLGTSYEHVRVCADVVLSYSAVWPHINAGLEHSVVFVKAIVDHGREGHVQVFHDYS